MPLDEELLAELKQTKAEIDDLQVHLKDERGGRDSCRRMSPVWCSTSCTVYTATHATDRSAGVG